MNETGFDAKIRELRELGARCLRFAMRLEQELAARRGDGPPPERDPDFAAAVSEKVRHFERLSREDGGGIADDQKTLAELAERAVANERIQTEINAIAIQSKALAATAARLQTHELPGSRAGASYSVIEDAADHIASRTAALDVQIGPLRLIQDTMTASSEVAGILSRTARDVLNEKLPDQPGIEGLELPTPSREAARRGLEEAERAGVPPPTVQEVDREFAELTASCRALQKEVADSNREKYSGLSFLAPIERPLHAQLRNLGIAADKLATNTLYTRQAPGPPRALLAAWIASRLERLDPMADSREDLERALNHCVSLGEMIPEAERSRFGEALPERPGMLSPPAARNRSTASVRDR